MEYLDLNSQTINHKYKPLSAGAYVGLTILFAIPIIGFISVLVFSCSNENIPARNYARSFLLGLLLIVLPLCILFFYIAMQFVNFLDSMTGGHATSSRTTSSNSIVSGLTTADTASFAKFCQDVDNVYTVVLNAYAEKKAEYRVNQITRTDEQIYMTIATGKDPGEFASMDGNCENINPKQNGLSHMTLPEVRKHNEAWYVTKDGQVFNATGFVHNKKTYFNASYYQNKELKAKSGSQQTLAPKIATAIVNRSGFEIQ